MTTEAHHGKGAPSAAALRPRSAPELIDASVVLTRRHFGALLTIAALGAALAIAWDTGARLLGIDAEADGTGAMLGFTVALALASVVSGAVTHAASTAYLTGRVNPADSIRRAAARWWTLAWVGVVISVFVLAGLTLLLVPGLFLLARYFAVFPAIVVEELGGLAAVRRSSRLSRGRMRKLLSTVGLAGVLYFILIVAVQWLAAELAGGDAAATAIGSVADALLMPIVTVIGVVAYYDARIEQEGFDIEYLAASVAPAGDAHALPGGARAR